MDQYYRWLGHRCCAFAFFPIPRPLIGWGRRWLLRAVREDSATAMADQCGDDEAVRRRTWLGDEAATAVAAADAPAWAGRCPDASVRAAGILLAGAGVRG